MCASWRPATRTPPCAPATSTSCSPATGCAACRSPTRSSSDLLQAADRRSAPRPRCATPGSRAARSRAPRADPLRVRTIEAVDDRRDRLGGLAFFTILILYGQLLTYGFWVATGVVEEKASRVDRGAAGHDPPARAAGREGDRARPARARPAADRRGDRARRRERVGRRGRRRRAADGGRRSSLLWFVLGYALLRVRRSPCAGALVPRQEELQAATTPLTMTDHGLAVRRASPSTRDPDGTLAHVTRVHPAHGADDPAAADHRSARRPRGRSWAVRRDDRGRGGADPGRRPDLRRRGPAHRLLDQAPRRLARGTGLRRPRPRGTRLSRR